MESRKLTYDRLTEEGACSDMRAEFLMRWPDGVVNVTVELAISQAHVWDWEWAGEHLLVDSQWTWGDALSAARAAHEDAVKPARQAHQETVSRANVARQQAFTALGDPFLPLHTAARQAAQTEWQQTVEPTRTAYNTALDAARDVFFSTLARAFAEQYIKEGKGSE